MPYHQTKGLELRALISDSLKDQILVLISKAVINFRSTLASVGYSLAQKASNNQEVAKTLCAAAEVVYDGFKGQNDAMTKYQSDTLQYSDASLMTTIFNNLILGVSVSEDEENPCKLDSLEILGEIRQTYQAYPIIHSDLCHD